MSQRFQEGAGEVKRKRKHHRTREKRGENGKKTAEGILRKALQRAPVSCFQVSFTFAPLLSSFRPAFVRVPSLFSVEQIRKADEPVGNLQTFTAGVLPCTPARTCRFPPARPAQRCQQDPGKTEETIWDEQGDGEVAKHVTRSTSHSHPTGVHQYSYCDITSCLVCMRQMMHSAALQARLHLQLVRIGN